MAEIAAGKGRAPKPFMTVKSGGAKSGGIKADAVWHSNRGEAAEARAKKLQGDRETSPGCRNGKRQKGRGDAGFRRAAVVRFGRPAAQRWRRCHEIKFDGYRVQLRVEDGEAVLKTRKGLDWTEKFP